MEQGLVKADDPELAAARMLYGRCLTKLGRYADAEAQLVPACETFSRSKDALPSAAREAHAGIRELYAAWDASEPGRGIAGRVERWKERFPAEE